MSNKYAGRKTTLPIIQPKYTEKAVWLSCERVQSAKEYIEIIYGADNTLIPDRYYIKREDAIKYPIISLANGKIDCYQIPLVDIKEVLPEENNPPEGPYMNIDFQQGQADIILSAMKLGLINSKYPNMEQNIQGFVDKTIDITIGVYWYTCKYCLEKKCIRSIQRKNYEDAEKWLNQAGKWITKYKRN